MTPFVLLFFGLLLILVEFFLPGMIMGILGGLLVVASLLVFIDQNSSPVLILLFVLGVVLALFLLIKYTLRRIPKARGRFSIYLKEDQENYKASKFDKSAIGKRGIVIADLKPGGYILVDGVKRQAISLTGYIPQGQEVIVVGGQEESLIVKVG
jgi:membrane-bound ClpP family serine protease